MSYTLSQHNAAHAAAARISAQALWKALLLAAIAQAPCVHEPCKVEITEHGWYARIEHLHGEQHADRVISTDTLIGSKREALVERLSRWLTQQHLAEPAMTAALLGGPDSDLVEHVDRSGAVSLLRDGGWSGLTAA